jgi:hypothetical protein
LLEKLDVKVLYQRNPENDSIKLDVSCVIPQFDGAIEYSPSRRSWPVSAIPGQEARRRTQLSVDENAAEYEV